MIYVSVVSDAMIRGGFIPVEFCEGHYVSAQAVHEAVVKMQASSALLGLREYMQKVRDADFNEKELVALAYSAKDKDCGYRSGLRFLGMQQTEETDAIANEMIYRNTAKKTVSKITESKKMKQLEMF